MAANDGRRAGMIRFDERVAIVTGAGGGLGRAHALALASRGAKVVVMDLRGAEAVVAEITAAGGEAMAETASVTDFEAVQAAVGRVLERWGRVDILVNNAGVLRDKTFAKMALEDFRLVLDVHLMGAVNCTKAVWEPMRQAGYGRVVMTTSSSGLYGNFGQSNYGAAKMALVGFMQTLALEGASKNIRVNCLAPTAATQMTEGLMPAEVLAMLKPESVSPGLLHLVSEDAPTRAILNAGAGAYERAYVTLTEGVFIGSGPDAPEQVTARWSEISDRAGEQVPDNGQAQGASEVTKASAASRSGPG
jgi:NAD(P)-dependent dehydrogenase (short-subunit alcohol dehydrogenase family)